jgi:ribonuclease BN (tRNA processing enzyme)
VRAIQESQGVQVTILPSSVSPPGEPPLQYLTTYLVNGKVAIDAGALGVCGTPREQAAIRHVFLSHTHIDHLATLPIFLDNVYQRGPGCPTLYVSDEVLDCLRRDIMNDRLWPDFIRLSDERPPFLRLHRLEPGRAVQVESLRITAVPVNHVVPTLGFLVEEDSAAVAFSSDTAPTEELWQLARRTPNLKAVFLEATFPEGKAWLAEVARHLTPSLFALEVAKLPEQTAVIAVHLQPRFQAEVIPELLALGLPNLQIGEPGRTYRF